MSRIKATRRALTALLMSAAMLAATAAQVMANSNSGPFPK